MKQFRITVGSAALALAMSAPAFAQMTLEEAQTQVRTALAAAPESVRGERAQWINAFDALIRAGVAPEKCVELVNAAMERKLVPGVLIEQAAQIEARSNGDKAAAGKYADEYAAAMQRREGAANGVRESFASPAHNGGAAAGSFGPAVNHGATFTGATRAGGR